MAHFHIDREWKNLPISSGTIENSSIGNIEISTSEEPGLIIYPKEKHEFRNVELKVRTLSYNTAVIRVVGFTSNASTGGSSSEGGGGSNTEWATRADIDAFFD